MGSVRSTTSLQQEDLMRSFKSHSLEVTNSPSSPHDQGTMFSKKQPRLSDLPNDLLLRIFSMCEARTVRRLRQCCKNFRELSTNQVVWLSVLKRTCLEINLPMPSFSQSAFTNSEVELLATAWLRFQSVLRTAKDGQPPPHKIVRLIRIKERFHSFDQSPDGRFLFVLQSSGLRVWDLWTPSPTQVGSFNMELPEDCWSQISVTFETDNSFLLYPVFDSTSPGVGQQLSFRFKYSSRAHRACQLDFLARLDQMSFPADEWYDTAMIPTLPFLATSFAHRSGGKYYVLWNPLSDTCASWAADSGDTSTYTQFLFSGEFIIALDEKSRAMFVYARPEIPPKDSYAPDVCAWLNNSALLHVPGETEMLKGRTTYAMHWKTIPNRGHLTSNHDGCASILDFGDDYWLLERLEIRRADSPCSTFAPLPLAWERSHSQLPRFRPIGDRWWSGTLDVCTDQSILLHSKSKESTKVVFHLSSSKENDGSVELASGVLYDSGRSFEIGVNDVSLCPFAGNLCIVTPNGIEVVDFVEMPYLNYSLKRGGAY
ncbi:hypothetical protein DL96DRAFT_1608299 [Flagelloscypha sp. PMI_526]|nr:hypothetical protein DL96DRAFT_1608299 [Flagelloscypha sp. PMI_526]